MIGLRSMAFVTYLYLDPKTSVPRYVGKGLENRPRQHITNPARSHQQLRRMLQKRIQEGFNPCPIVILASDEADAFEMEELLISMIGRIDLKTGPLFNHTNGGEGTSGRIVSEEIRRKTSQSFHSRTAEEKAKTFTLLSTKKRAMWNSWSNDQRKAFADKQVEIKSRACTIDGITFFKSRLDLIKALGQSQSGNRSPNFRYI
jgi:hypothetical protein